MSLPGLTLLSEATIAKGLAGEAAFKTFIHSAAENVASFATSNAPGEEGKYIHAEGEKVVYRNPRSAWHIVEFGSINNMPYSPLRRAVTDAGLNLTEDPKP